MAGTRINQLSPGIPTDADSFVFDGENGTKRLTFDGLKKNIKELGPLINQWDEEWEVGTINISTGTPAQSTTKIRSKNFCLCKPSTQYHLIGVPGKRYYIIEYNENREYVDHWTITETGRKITTNQNTRYFKLTTEDYAAPYNNDISVNYPSTYTDYYPAGISAKANKTDALTLEEIKASTDLSGKIASAQSVKQLNSDLNALIVRKNLDIGSANMVQSSAGVFYQNVVFPDGFKPNGYTQISAELDGWGSLSGNVTARLGPSSVEILADKRVTWSYLNVKVTFAKI